MSGTFSMTNPIITTELFAFQQENLDPSLANITNSSLSSDQYLCVCEATSNVTVINMRYYNKVKNYECKADRAIMHPYRDIIVLDIVNVIQILSFESLTHLLSFDLPNDTTVSYWTWVDEDTFAFIAGYQVYHWSLSNRYNSPQAVFTVNDTLNVNRIINYSVSNDQKWFVVSAIDCNNDQTYGKIQLFSKEKNVSQILNAYAGTFAKIGQTQVLLFAVKENGNLHLNIFSLGNSQQEKQFIKKSIELPMAQDAADDIPLQIVASPRYKSCFLFTQMGYMYITEYEIGLNYLSARVSQVPFVQAALSHDGVVVSLFKNGRVAKFNINDKEIYDFISDKRNSPQVAANVASGIQTHDSLLDQILARIKYGGNQQILAKIEEQSKQISEIRALIDNILSICQSQAQSIANLNKVCHNLENQVESSKSEMQEANNKLDTVVKYVNDLDTF